MKSSTLIKTKKITIRTGEITFPLRTHRASIRGLLSLSPWEALVSPIFPINLGACQVSHRHKILKLGCENTHREGTSNSFLSWKNCTPPLVTSVKNPNNSCREHSTTSLQPISVLPKLVATLDQDPQWDTGPLWTEKPAASTGQSQLKEADLWDAHLSNHQSPILSFYVKSMREDSRKTRLYHSQSNLS